MDLISVIIRTKNRPDRLREAMASVAAQTHTDIELIVVNDGGSPVSDLIANCQARFKNVIQLLTHAESKGRSAALNRGLHAANGAWIAILDDDDLYHPDALSVLYRQATQRQLQVVYGIIDLIDCTTEKRTIKKQYATPFSKERLLFENYIPIHALLIQRELLSTVGYIDESFHIFEDWDFLFRLSLEAPFGFVEEVVGEYRDFGSATTVATHDTHAHRNARQQFYAKNWNQINAKYLAIFYELVYQDSELKFRSILNEASNHIKDSQLQFENFFDIMNAVAQRLNRQDTRLNEFEVHFSNLFDTINIIADRIATQDQRNNELLKNIITLHNEDREQLKDQHRQHILLNQISIDFHATLTQKISALEIQIDHKNALMKALIERRLGNRLWNFTSRNAHRLINFLSNK